MLTDRSQPPAITARHCSYCPRRVTWMRTYIGHDLCFDAAPVPRSLDTLREGWLPGTFTIRGKKEIVLAPLARHDHRKAQRAQHVMLLHNCPGQSTRQASA